MTPTRSTGRMPAYRFDRARTTCTTSSAANDANRTRGFELDQNNVSGERESDVGNSGYLSARGGYFYDSYKDTGVPSTTSYTYQSVEHRHAGIPVSLQGPVNTANTPRIQISNFDTTDQGFVQLDYNHAFKGGHLLKGGWGVRRSVNDVDVAYPGGYVYLYWGSRSGARPTGSDRHRHVRLLPSGRPRDARARSARTSRTCTCRTRGRSARV